MRIARASTDRCAGRPVAIPEPAATLIRGLSMTPPPAPRNATWLAPLLAIVLVAAVVLGFAGIFLAPLAAFIAVFAVIALIVVRRSAGKPALDPDEHARHRA
jgi:hypothetical protein